MSELKSPEYLVKMRDELMTAFIKKVFNELMMSTEPPKFKNHSTSAFASWDVETYTMTINGQTVEIKVTSE